MRIFYFHRDDTACTFYRQTIPLNTWKKNDPDLIVDHHDRNTLPKDIEDQLLNSDIFVVGRAVENEIQQVIDERRKLGKYTVLDYDDDLFHLSPFSPHYHDFGTENIVVKLPDKEEPFPMWTDGENIDLKANQKKLDAVKKNAGKADLVTVTTPYLKRVFSLYTDKIAVLPNCIDTDLWKWRGLDTKDRNEVRLYWSGGASHYEDWSEIARPLANILNSRPEVKLVIMGQKFNGTLKPINNKDQIEFHPWVHFEAYSYKTIFLQPDIGIIPLKDITFNHGKSTIKYCELGSLQVPCVVSHVPPYTMVCKDKTGIFIEKNDPDLWEKGINMLIDDPLLRASIGHNARTLVESEYDINKKWILWKEAYEGMKK